MHIQVLQTLTQVGYAKWFPAIPDEQLREENHLSFRVRGSKDEISKAVQCSFDEKVIKVTGRTISMFESDNNAIDSVVYAGGWDKKANDTRSILNTLIDISQLFWM
jgi:hypothetical protein